MVIAEHRIHVEHFGVVREGDAVRGGEEGPAVLHPLPGAHVAGSGVARQRGRALPCDEGGGGGGVGDGRPCDGRCNQQRGDSVVTALYSDDIGGS